MVLFTWFTKNSTPIDQEWNKSPYAGTREVEGVATQGDKPLATLLPRKSLPANDTFSCKIIVLTIESFSVWNVHSVWIG